MKKRLTILSISLLFLGWVVLASAMPSLVAYVEPAPVIAAPVADRPLLDLINELRAEKGVAPLTASPELNKSAQLKADDLAAQHYFEHVSPQGKHGYEYIKEVLPNRIRATENLAICGENDNNTGAFKTWMNSPAHYQGMIDPKVTLYGEGKAWDDQQHCTVYVNHFAAV